jgi:hypothetical protein
MAAYNNIDEMDIDDENDWKAMDSDDDDENNNHDDNDNDNYADDQVERDDDVDIGFRSHQFQYGAHGRNRKRSRKQNQEEAIYGVFYDNNDNDNNNRGNGSGSGNRRRDDDGDAMNIAPLFVPATKTPKAAAKVPAVAPMMFVAASKKDETKTETANNAVPASMLFVAASTNQQKEPDANETTAPATTATTTTTTTTTFAQQAKQTKSTDKDTATDEDDDAEEEKCIVEEQKEADDRFKELLEKAKARNKKTRPRSKPSATTTPAPNPNAAFVGIGRGSGGLGLPSSFGLGGGGGGLGFSNEDNFVPKKDPTVGTWEKHTKGFGSKLLAKMGWKGSGGLGSNHRAFRGGANETNENKNENKTITKNKEGIIPAKNEEESISTTIAATSSDQQPQPQQVGNTKKGISRPVEVVVRPTNMGLGFGKFKEASQLKTNRRIEAEVRGIDYDAQLAKEKNEAKLKRRQQRNQRYGNNNNNNYKYDSSTDEDEDENNNVRTSKNVNSSAIPSTEDLLSNQSWKAKRSSSSRSTTKSNSKKRKGASGLPEIIPYQELIKRQKQKHKISGTSSDHPVIIDMRGPTKTSTTTTRGSSSSSGVVVPLGEEMLYNLSFLLGTYETKLHSSSRHHETSILRTIQGLDRQILDAEDRFQKATTRRTKLARAHEIAQTVQDTLISDHSSFGVKKQTVNQLVSELKDVFTREERSDLQFWNVLAPTLLGPIMETTLENWKPFFATASDGDNCNGDRPVVDSFFEWTPSGGNNSITSSNNNSNTNHESNDDEGRILCESMVRNQLVPKLRADIEAQASQVWDPVTNPYVVLDLYDYLRAKALAFDDNSTIPNSDATIENGDGDNDDDNPNQIFPSSRGDEDEFGSKDPRASSSHMAAHIEQELIREALYPKLQAAIANWKPTLSSQTKQLLHPLHLWVLPWLPHIDHPILLPNLLTECKRRLKSALSLLQRGIPSLPEDNDRAYVASVLDLLRPWHTILDQKSLQKMLTENRAFFPRLERLLVASFAAKDSNDWKSLRMLFELHGNHLISDVEFLSLLEGPFLVTWAGGIHSRLCRSDSVPLASDELNTQDTDNQSVLGAALSAYRECKIRVLVDPHFGNEKKSSFSYSRSLVLLRGDRTMCRIFYSIVCMIQIYHQSLSSSSSTESEQLLQELDLLEPEVQGFYMIRGRRSMEEKQKLREDYAVMQSRSKGESRARVILQHRNIPEPTFREVVEAFAGDRSVVFRPKHGARRDGKQIYLFGDRAIYLEGDVVFCHDGDSNSWRPVSLDQLGVMATV